MPKQVLRRTAADNVYHHPDFHGALSAGLIFLQDRLGEDAVRRYLRQFAQAYCAPLTAEVRARGLVALREFLERTYALEGGAYRLTGSGDELLLEVERCPAVTHMRAHGYPVSPLFGETSLTLYAAICEGTPFTVEMPYYHLATGASRLRFYPEALLIPCTDFIPAYSELFKFLAQEGGKGLVLEFWEYLSENFLGNLRELVTEHGLRGCWLYWEHTLNEEAADFTMELDEEAGEFRIALHHCPSMGRLLAEPSFEAYGDYCGHCDVLYRRVLEPLGYECCTDMSRIDQAACDFVVRRRG